MRRPLLALLPFALAGCFREMPSDRPPIHLNPNMDDQAKVRPQEPSTFFADGAAMRPSVPGTVPRGFLREDDRFFKGMEGNGQPVRTNPVPVTAENLRRGRERFDIYCSSCHGRTGNGKGIVVEKGLPPPTSYQDPKLLAAPDGHFYDVITNGIRNMPSYAAQIPPADRWKIVAYVRALQRSQNAKAEDVPVEVRRSLGAEGVKP